MYSMRRFNQTLPHLLRVAALALMVGCAGSDSRDAPGEEAAEPRVPSNPTAVDALPPSIVGQAGALQGSEVHYFANDPSATGYLAVPEGEGPFPAVIMIHEWNGLVDRVRQLADDLAAEGYVALAADLYSGRAGTNQQENIALVQEVQGDMGTVIANLDAAAAFLRSRPDVTGKIGAMGWCFGGGIALSYGLGGERHDATAIFYGRLVEDPAQLAALDHEVYGTFARLDQGPPPDQVDRFTNALREAGVENDIHIYDEVNHGFWLHLDGDPEVRTEPGLNAWQRLKAYLDRTLRED